MRLRQWANEQLVSTFQCTGGFHERTQRFECRRGCSAGLNNLEHAAEQAP